MNQKNISAIFAFVIVIALIGFFAYRTLNKPRTSNKSDEVKTVAVKEEVKSEANETKDQQFALVKELDDVFYKTENNEYKKLEDPEINLSFGTYVKTSDKASAYVVYKNNSVMTLDSNSEVQVNGDEDNVEVSQILGRTWHRIEKLNENQNYEVKTGTAIAAVRGTLFEVVTSKEGVDDLASISLVEGKIECRQYSSENGKIEIKNKKMLMANKTATIRDFKKKNNWLETEISTNKKNEDWFKKNVKLNERLREKKEEINTNTIKSILKERITNSLDTTINKDLKGNMEVSNTASANVLSIKEAAQVNTVDSPLLRILDKTPPEISVGNVKDGLAITEKTEVTLAFKDNKDLKNAIVTVNGKTVKTCVFSGALGRCSYTFDPAGFQEGNYVLLITAYDSSDNKATKEIKLTIPKLSKEQSLNTLPKLDSVNPVIRTDPNISRR